MCVIGLDLGTTNCKAVALANDGTVRAVASLRCKLRTPQSGWVEQDVNEIWAVAVEALQQVVAELEAGELDGLCLSGAMHSVLPVGQDGAPLAPAMTWADSRAAGYVDLLRTRIDAGELYQRTGCPLRSTYHAPRLRWWFGQATQVAQRAARFVAIKDWILFQLTGVWASDVGLASTTGLLDILRQCWDDEALNLAGISSDRLCPLVPSEKVVGAVSREAAAATRLPQGLAVVAGASDGGLANLGAGATQGGQVVLTVGTSGAIRKIVERPWLDPQERTWCYVFPNGLFFAGGAINNGGLALEWVRDRFYSELPAEEGYERMLEDAASVSPGADGVTLLPYFTGERSPHWTACARALLHGLGMQHGREHFSRAALEGIAFCLADVWQALAPQGELEQFARLTGGITQAPVWMQVVADVLGVPLSPLQAADASAVGAAILGHWALGNWESLSSRRLQEAALTDVLPEPGRHALYVERHAVFQSLFRLAQGLC